MRKKKTTKINCNKKLFFLLELVCGSHKKLADIFDFFFLNVHQIQIYIISPYMHLKG